jgi:hypothetical protein
MPFYQLKLPTGGENCLDSGPHLERRAMALGGTFHERILRCCYGIWGLYRHGQQKPLADKISSRGIDLPFGIHWCSPDLEMKTINEWGREWEQLFANCVKGPHLRVRPFNCENENSRFFYIQISECCWPTWRLTTSGVQRRTDNVYFESDLVQLIPDLTPPKVAKFVEDESNKQKILRDWLFPGLRWEAE